MTWLHDSYGVHTMENAGKEEHAITLHVYHPPYVETKIYDEQGNVSLGCGKFDSKMGRMLKIPEGTCIKSERLF